MSAASPTIPDPRQDNSGRYQYQTCTSGGVWETAAHKYVVPIVQELVKLPPLPPPFSILASKVMDKAIDFDVTGIGWAIDNRSALMGNAETFVNEASDYRSYVSGTDMWGLLFED